MAVELQSMTGFASVEGEAGAIAFTVDARSVNGRSLDVRLRLPQGMESHEPAIRKMVASAFRRGSVTLNVTTRRGESAARYTVNEDQLSRYLAAIQQLAATGSVAAPRADGLMALRGVIEATEADDTQALAAALPAAAERTIAALAADWQAEGARIGPVIEGQLAQMERLRVAIDGHPQRSLDAVKARVDAQVAQLLSGSGLSQERLHQEAALIATRADVREELDRLEAHVAAARELLAEGGAVGRKLDFLAQELNRETNTICSKSPHHEVTALGLELKAAVEQMREQVQNLE